jgi:hypothetical protein
MLEPAAEGAILPAAANAQPQETTLASYWCKGPASYATFLAQVAGGPETLQHIDLSPYMCPGFVLETPANMPVVYLWQICILSRPLYQLWLQSVIDKMDRAEADGGGESEEGKEGDDDDDKEDEDEEDEEDEDEQDEEKANGKPATRHSVVRAFRLHMAAFLSHHGGLHVYGGMSTDIRARYHFRLWGHGNTLLHHKVSEFARIRPDVVQFAFGVVARGPQFDNSDDSTRFALGMEYRLGKDLKIGYADLSRVNGHVINNQLLGCTHSRFGAISVDRPKLLELARWYYMGGHTSQSLASLLEELAQCGHVTSSAAAVFCKHHLKPHALEAGVPAVLLTAAAAVGRSHGNLFDIALLEQQAREVVATGLRVDHPPQGTNGTGGAMKALIAQTSYAQPPTDGGKQLRLFLRKVCQPALVSSFAPDSAYALVRGRLLELGTRLDATAPPKPTKFERAFDKELDAIELDARLPCRHRAYRCAHCDVGGVQGIMLSGLKKHYMNKHHL